MHQSTPAGWFRAPTGRHVHRYWDGFKWTDYVGSPGQSQSIDSLEGPQSLEVAFPGPAPGWQRDPFHRYEHRYWDGARWTDLVGSHGRQQYDPPVHHAANPAYPDPDATDSRRGVTEEASAIQEGVSSALFTEKLLVINQQAKLIGSTLGYAVLDRHGERLGTIQEVRRSLGTLMGDRVRGHIDSTRGYRFQLVDTGGRVMLAMTRPPLGWTAMKGRLAVEGPDGGVIGQIVHDSSGLGGNLTAAVRDSVKSVTRPAAGGMQGRLGSAMQGLSELAVARFVLEADGERLAVIRAENLKKWDFQILDTHGVEIGRITKTWAGWVKERFTKADNYVIEMHSPLEEPLRSLVVAGALAIDVELKQHGAQTRRRNITSKRKYN